MANSKIPLPTNQYTKAISDPVNLNGYTSPSNSYTFPSDGYLILDSATKTSGLIDARIQGSNGGNVAFMFMNITGQNQKESLFVRKGMKCYVNDRSSDTNISFRALSY